MENITSHSPGRIEGERRDLLAQVRALPPGAEALEKLAFVREEYDWAVEDYRHSLNILSDTTYQDRKHFLLELIQNADDAQFAGKEAKLRFVILKDSIELYYNEKGFDVDNVIAITGTGSSTKRSKHRSANSFIGEKGIGFKSVFALATDVEIESPPWHFYLTKKRCIVPEPLTGGRLSQGEGTRLKVRFADPTIVDLVAEELDRYVSGQVESFLFLQRLSSFEVEDRRSTGISLKGLKLEPANRAGKTLTLNTFPTKNTTRQYLLYSEEIEFSAELVKERWEKLELDAEGLTRKIIVAALVDTDNGVLPKGRLYCFLPTEVKLPVPIYLQVDGHTKADRERLHDPQQNRWNRHLLGVLPNVLRRAILDWRNEPLIANRLPNFIPTDPGTDQLAPIFAALMKVLPSMPWIRTLDEQDQWVSPNYALRTDKYWSKLFVQFPDFRRLAEEYLGMKFMHPDWTENSAWAMHWKYYKIPMLSDLQISELICYVPLPTELLKEENLFSGLYPQLIYMQKLNALRYPIDGPKINSSLLGAPIFPLEGGALGPLKLNAVDKVFWIASRSRRTTGLEGTEGAALKIVNIEYTYRPEAGSEASKERISEVKRISDRNAMVRELLTKLQVAELNDETVLAELQIPWLLNRTHYGEQDNERTFAVLSAIFEAYRAKRTHEEEFLKQLSKLENSAFPSFTGKRESLKELLLPPQLRLKPEDNLYAAGQEYNSLALPESFLEPPPSEAKQVSSDREQERKRKLIEEWRQFLIFCGIKGKPRFMFTTVKYKPRDFSEADYVRSELWIRHIKRDYTSQNPVELITVQLDSGTRAVLAGDNYDKKMMAESLYSTWMESFGKQSLNIENNHYYRDNPPAGYFLTRYRRHDNRSPVIKDQDWGGIDRKFIPLKTVSGATTTAVLGLRIPNEQLTQNYLVATQYLPLVTESMGSGRGYHPVYLNSLNVRALRVSDINALWDKLDEKQYPDIIKIALEVAEQGISLAGLELYDYEQSRLRSAKDFHLGLEGTKGSALIERQYGQDGQRLGKLLGLTAETDANLFLGLFDRILDGVIYDDEAGKQVYRLLKYWSDWDPTSRGLIAGDLREALQLRHIDKPPVIICNDTKIRSLYSKAKIRMIYLDIKSEEQYLIEKVAKEIGFDLPGESGKLVCTGEQSLSERERNRFNQLVDGFFDLLELHEAARLKSLIAGFGTPGEWETHVVKVESAERRFGENRNFAIPLQLPYLEDRSRLIVTLTDSPEVILARLLSLYEFTTYRHALRDLKDIKVIGLDAPKPVKPAKQEILQNEDRGSDATDRKASIKAKVNQPILNEEADEETNEETLSSAENASTPQQNADPRTIAKSIFEALTDSRQAQMTEDTLEWKTGLDPDEEVGLRSGLIQDLAQSLAKGPERHEKQIRQRVKNTKTVPDNIKLVDVDAEDSTEFLGSEYNGQCQVCGTELRLSNGNKWIEVFHILPVGQDNWWGNRPFNILGLCPNCHALARHGGGLDLNNIFGMAEDLIKGLALPEEVPEYHGDFYKVPIMLNGISRRLVISKLHLNHIASLLETAANEAAATTEADENSDGDFTIPLVRRLGRNIPSQIMFQDKVLLPSTTPDILTSVLEELLILRPEVINNLDSKYPFRKQSRFTYDSEAFPDNMKFEQLSNGMYVISTSNIVRTLRMTYSILGLCGYRKEDLRMIYDLG